MVGIMITSHPLRRTGIFFSAAFALGILLNILKQGMISGQTILGVLLNPTIVSLYVCLAILLIATLSKRFAILQPLLLLAVAPLPILQVPDGMYGLALFVCGSLLLYKGGFLETKRTIKVTLLLSYLYGIEVFAMIGKGRAAFPNSLMPTFFVSAFLAFLYMVFQEQVVVYLKEKKPILSLSEKGLSEAEANYVRGSARGLSQKEIAAEFGVSDSTVRNTLANAYKKLGVADKTELAKLLATHELVD